MHFREEKKQRLTLLFRWAWLDNMIQQWSVKVVAVIEHETQPVVLWQPCFPKCCRSFWRTIPYWSLLKHRRKESHGNVFGPDKFLSIFLRAFPYCTPHLILYQIHHDQRQWDIVADFLRALTSYAFTLWCFILESCTCNLLQSVIFGLFLSSLYARRVFLTNCEAVRLRFLEKDFGRNCWLSACLQLSPPR